MILSSRRGMTLIELIVFIIVAGMFIPLAYLAFSTAVKDTTAPETSVKLRFIAETKIEDITRYAYDAQLTSQPPQTTFVDVGSPHTGYQWKWTYENIAYQDNANHTTTTITNALPSLGSSSSFKVGDYIVSPDSGSTSFYRAHFLKWVNNTLYNLNNYVVPTSSTYNLPFQVINGGTSALLAANEPNWLGAVVGTPYEDGGVTWRSVGGFGFPVGWNSNTSYALGDEVRPTLFSRYRCITSGKSGILEPSWPMIPGQTVYDGLQWQAINATPTMTLASVPPPLPWLPLGNEVNDNSSGNQIRWILSDVYRRITVVVRPPNCTTSSCEYSVSTIVTSRTAP